MASRPGWSNTKLALVAVLDGLSLWFLAVLYGVHTSEDLAWETLAAFPAVARAAVRRWIASPGVGPAELVAYAGLVLTVVGPLWFVVGRRVLDGDGFGPSSALRNIQTNATTSLRRLVTGSDGGPTTARTEQSDDEHAGEGDDRGEQPDGNPVENPAADEPAGGCRDQDHL